MRKYQTIENSIWHSKYTINQFATSIQFSHSVVSNSLWPHGLQHARLPCLSSTPGACSDSCLLSWWCHPTISSSVVPSPPAFNLPASGSFPMSQFFTSGGQSIGVSASASVLPVNIQDWFPLGLTSWISLQSKGLSRIFSNTTVQKHQFFRSKEQASFNFMTAVTICSDFAAQENFGGKLNHGLWCWRVPWFPHLCCVT